MAPVPGVSRQDVLSALKAYTSGRFQLDMGSPHRDSIILFDGESWQLCPMVVSQEEIFAAHDRAMAAGHSFQPENVVELQRPGTPIIKETTLKAFLTYIERIPWNFGGVDLELLPAYLTKK
jgi:hypothetical protein